MDKLLKFVLVLLAILQVQFLSIAHAQLLNTLKSKIDIFDVSNTTSQKTTISSAGPDASKAKTLVWLTGASYCFELSKWSCPYCKKAQGLGYEYSTNVSNPTANTFGIITVNKAKKEIVVTIRGTFNVANVLTDAAQTQASIGGGSGSKKSAGKKKKLKDKIKSALSGGKSSSSKILVHNGFLKATNSLYPQIVKKLGALLKKNKGYSVILSGHSLGAGIASIVLYMLQQKIKLPSNFPTPASYAYFGYGEPRVGNKPYADYMNNQKGVQITRIVNKADPIPHLPTALQGYVHHGTEYWIKPITGEKSCSKKVYEDSTCSNSLGPVYNPLDHVQYWDVAYLSCGLKDPIQLLSQFVVPLSTG